MFLSRFDSEGGNFSTKLYCSMNSKTKALKSLLESDLSPKDLSFKKVGATTRAAFHKDFLIVLEDEMIREGGSSLSFVPRWSWFVMRGERVSEIKKSDFNPFNVLTFSEKFDLNLVDSLVAGNIDSGIKLQDARKEAVEALNNALKEENR